MKFVIAAKREYRDKVRADWVDKVRSIEGISVDGDLLFGRLTVEASDAAIGRVRSLLGDEFHVEEIKRYKTRENECPRPRSSPDAGE